MPVIGGNLSRDIRDLIAFNINDMYCLKMQTGVELYNLFI